jgi:hypothetical protein
MFLTAFLITAVLGFLAGILIPFSLLLFLGWLNFLVLIVVLAAWSKADKDFSVCFIMATVVFWLFAYGGSKIVGA